MVAPSKFLAPTSGACACWTGGESFVMQSSASDFNPCRSSLMLDVDGDDGWFSCSKNVKLDKTILIQTKYIRANRVQFVFNYANCNLLTEVMILSFPNFLIIVHCVYHFYLLMIILLSGLNRSSLSSKFRKLSNGDTRAHTSSAN